MAAGLCLSVVVMDGCKGLQGRSPKSSNEAVNTGLGSIGNERVRGGVDLPGHEELVAGEDEFLSVSEQIAESARQLNVYFANMEIDGVEAVDPETHVRVGLPGTEVVQETEAGKNTLGEINDPAAPVESAARSNSSESDDNDADNDADDGVRVSLLGGGDDGEREQGDESAQEADIEVDPQREIKGAAADPMVRKEELARELAAVLSLLASTSDDPGSAALALAGLETLLPKDTESLVDEGVLSDAERASLDAARAFLRSMSSEGSIASPAMVATELEVIQEQLSAWAGIVVKKAALCVSVDGYGRYETFPSYRFIAGQSQPVIVYVELERFGQREFVGPDGQARFETKLSQRLELYHVADDLNTWNRAAQPVTDVARNRVRDYYLINQISLPANLGVGRYHLKVVTRDLIGDKVAEAIIPIEIVAR